MFLFKYKILNFGFNSFLVLGVVNYFILLINFIFKIKKIIQQKKLTSIDNTFKKISIKFNNKKFFLRLILREESLNYLM